jgi:hypothetical protein
VQERKKIERERRRKEMRRKEEEERDERGRLRQLGYANTWIGGGRQGGLVRWLVGWLVGWMGLRVDRLKCWHMIKYCSSYETQSNKNSPA